MEKKRNALFLIVVAVILTIISLKCKKDDQQNKIQYDLFPLKVGNEYYYHYKYSYDDFLVGYDSIGTEKWTVLTDSKNSNNTEYIIEKKFNCIYVNWSILQSDKHRDTTFNVTRTSHFIITEKPSGELLFWDISIPRFFNKPDTNFHVEYYHSIDFTKSYVFKADSGLTSYYNFWGLMSHRIRESLIQDSVKISR